MDVFQEGFKAGIRKRFFFEKKNQKAFAPLVVAWGADGVSRAVPG
jgi:hypothetical protein